jgi:hypothetical protein
MIAAGWAAQRYSPSATIAVSGLLGVVAAVAITLTSSQQRAAGRLSERGQPLS